MIHNQSDHFDFENQQQSNNQEEFTAVLNALLPDIEKQLMKDIENQLEAQFQQKYLKAIQQLEGQALQQYQRAIEELEESRQILANQKQTETQNQIQQLQNSLQNLQEQTFLKLQQKFLQENFDSRVMNHPKILFLQKSIEEEIFTHLEEKHEATKQRQLKELIIAHETKQVKLRKQLDLQIKERIYYSSGLQELKQQIKQSRTQMGSQKSQYNLKLKKIQTEINDYEEKIKQFQKMPDIQKLKLKLEELKIDLIQKQTEKMLEDDEKRRSNSKDLQQKNLFQRSDDDSLDEYSQEDQNQNDFLYNKKEKVPRQQTNSKTLTRQPKNQLLAPGSQFSNNQDMPYFIEERQMFPKESFDSSQNNHKKIDLTAYFKGYVLHSQTAKITQSQNFSQGNQDRKSLLNLGNISEILKQKISSDPLQKYMNRNNGTKQNDMNLQNLRLPTGQRSSNFAELYEKHLRNLNKGLGKKGSVNSKNTSKNNAGLSDLAKRTIIKNLTLYHKNNFQDQRAQLNNLKMADDFNSSEIEISNTYETDLLASCK